MEYYPLRNPFKEQISPSTTSKQIPLQEDPSFYYEHFKNLHLQASNPRSNHDGSNSTRSVSASRNEGKTLRDQLKDLSDESSRQRTRSISPFKQGSNKQTASLRENMMNNREINYGKETENRQRGKGVMEKCGVQEKKKDTDCSYSWNEEEEDSRKYESIVTEDSMREDEIREKLMQMQEDILKKMKLKGRSVQNSRFMDGSFLNETLLNIGKPSVSPSSLTSLLASHENSQYMMNQTKRNSIAKENNSLRSLNTTMDKGKAKKSSLDFNDNYSRIVHIDSKITDSQDSSLRKSRNFGLALDIDPSILMGCTKLQLFLQKSKFRSLNSSFRLIKEKPMMMILKDTSRMGDLSRREASMCETPFSFRTCVSAVTERYSNVQLGTVMVKNVMNKRLQCAFFALKSKLSFHQLQYKASIASGAIILSKLFRAHERSLSLQCLGVWKLRHALQMQRDEELAEKNQEIKKLSQEKNQALFTLAEEQDKWMLTHSPQATPKPLRESTKMEQISNKENSMQGQVPQGFGKQGLEKVEMKEKSVLIKKTPDILDETRKANQLLYEQLKALYDKKCFVEEAQPKASKPLSVVNSNTSYQKPFLLGQPNKNGGESKQDGMVLRVSTGRLSNSRESCLESEDRCLSSKQMSKRSSVASHAYDSFDREAALNSRQSRRGSSRIWE